ncbi:MAG: hypothetical protein IT168_21745 [Bryobacterales bacterium]|nr:hypothetical protein [Bryobacterales bacterium]
MTLTSGPSRRQWMEDCIVRGLLVSAAPVSQTALLGMWQHAEQQAAKPTPAEVLGPFFKKGAPNTPVLRVAGDPGFPLRVSGKVYNTRGEVVRDARVDVWHADHHGEYDVQGYKYRAKLTPDAQAVYAVETIMPGHYPDRPAQHVHYLITAPGHKTLVTQLYFATDPFFDGNPDKNYTRRGIVTNRDCVRPVMLYEGPGAARAAVTFDIVLERA